MAHEKATAYVRYLKDQWRRAAGHVYELEREIERLEAGLTIVEELLRAGDGGRPAAEAIARLRTGKDIRATAG